MRVRGGVAYDGAPFHGFAPNAGVPTVAGLLDEALSRVLRTRVVVACAGRTDRGVHAVGKVISFDAPDDVDLDLSERPRNCLKRAQVDTIGQLLEKTEDDLLAVTNFGQKSLDEVIEKLDERGLALRIRG